MWNANMKAPYFVASLGSSDLLICTCPNNSSSTVQVGDSPVFLFHFFLLFFTAAKCQFFFVFLVDVMSKEMAAHCEELRRDIKVYLRELKNLNGTSGKNCTR